MSPKAEGEEASAARARKAEALTRSAETVFLAAILAAPWPYGSASERAAFLLSGALLAGLGLWAAARWLEGAGLPRLLLPACGLPALGLAQLLAGRSAAPVWTAETLLVLVPMTLMIVFWSERARDKAAALRLAGAVLAACFLQAAFGVAQWSRGAQRIYGESSALVSMPFGSFVNHNHFAGLMEMGAVLAAGMAAGRALRRGRVTPTSLALLGLGLMLVASHLASRSRGGLLALLAGVMVLGALGALATAGNRLRWAPAIAIAILVFFGFGWAVIPPASREHLATLLRGSAEPAGAYRLDVGIDTLRLAAHRPLLGWGLGAYADAFSAFKRRHGGVRTVHAESDVLEFLAEGGLMGVVLAAWLAVAVLRGFRDRLVHGHDPFRKGVAAGAMAGASALLVHSLLDFNLRIPSNALVFVSLVGVASSPRSPATLIGSRRAAGALALLLGGLALAAFWRSDGARVLGAALERRDPNLRIPALGRVLDRHLYLAKAYCERGRAWRDMAARAGAFAGFRLSQAEGDITRCLALRPNWGEAWAELAWVRFFRGDLSGAHAALESAGRLDPTHLGMGVARAELWARLGGADRAVREVAALRRMNPWWSLDAALGYAMRWSLDKRLLKSLTDGSVAEFKILENTLARHSPPN